MATDARQHTVPASTDHPSRSTLLTLSLSVRDINVVANTTARATLISNLTSAGQGPSTTNPVVVYRADARADSCLEVTTDGTTWRAVPLSSGLQSFTPVLTAVTTSPTLGTGSAVSGEYETHGAKCTGKATISAGSSGTTAGSGIYQVSLPVAAEAGSPTNGDVVGYGTLFDSSGGLFKPFTLRCVDSTTTARLIDNNAGTYWTQASPVAFSTGDKFQYRFDYEIA